MAAELGLPLLAKDVIKESLFDALGHVDDDPLASSQRLGGAAMELLWRLAAECPAVVIEANFRTQSAFERDEVRELCARPVEVHCRIPVDVAAARYAERGARDDHHAVHVARSTPLSFFEEFVEPFGIGTVVEVDTTTPVDVVALAARVRDALQASTLTALDAGFSARRRPSPEPTPTGPGARDPGRRGRRARASACPRPLPQPLRRPSRRADGAGSGT